jgi:hypothetical protein
MPALDHQAALIGVLRRIAKGENLDAGFLYVKGERAK